MDNRIIILTVLETFSFLGLVISAYLLFFRKILMGRTLGVMFFSSSVASFAYAMEISTTEIAGKFQWVIIRYIYLMVFALTIALFVFDYCRIPVSFKSWKFFWLAIIPGIALFFLAINPDSPRIYYQDEISIGNVQKISRVIGPVYIFLQAYVIGLLIVLVFIILKYMKQKTKLDRINSTFIASGLILYLSTHLMQLAGIRLMGIYSLNIFTYFPTAMLTLWGVQRYRLADIRPIAYRTIFDQMQDGLLVIDCQGHIVDFNLAAEKYLCTMDRLSPGDLFDLKKLNITGVKSLENSGVTSRLKSKVNGIPVQIMISGLFDQSENFYGHLVCIRDISSQFEAERLKEAEIIRKGAWEERARMARALHDSALQNVGSLIMLSGSISQSLADHPSDEARKLLETLRTGANLAYEDLRAFITELQIDDAEKPFDFQKTLEAKLCYFRQQGQSRINLIMPDSLPVDAQQQRELSYIILEAVNNAFKHARADSITINIREHPGMMAVEISDDGCGFDPENPNHRGMGLQNIHSRVSLLKGNLLISSQPDHGTCVCITLPVVQIYKGEEQTEEVA